MSNLISIEELRKEFQQKTKIKDLKAFAEQQQAVIESLLFQNKNLLDKVSHLENMLLSLQKSSVVMSISAEEMICIEQIEVLKSKSNGRELSLDEVKRLDLLIKNLRLIREQSTQVIETKDYSDVLEDDLVAIATKTDDI